MLMDPFGGHLLSQSELPLSTALQPFLEGTIDSGFPRTPKIMMRLDSSESPMIQVVTMNLSSVPIIYKKCIELPRSLNHNFLYIHSLQVLPA